MELTNEDLQTIRTNKTNRYIKAVKPFLNKYKLSYINNYGSLVIESDISTFYKGNKILNGTNIYGNRYISIPISVIESDSELYNVLSIHNNVLDTYVSRNREPLDRNQLIEYEYDKSKVDNEPTLWVPSGDDITNLQNMVSDEQKKNYKEFISHIGFDFNQSKTHTGLVLDKLSKTKLSKLYDIDRELGNDLEKPSYKKLKDIKFVVSILDEINIIENYLIMNIDIDKHKDDTDLFDMDLQPDNKQQ